MSKPKVVAIVGSSRFKQFHLGHAQRLTLQGKIVLLAGFWHHVDNYPISSSQKEDLDELTRAKVELADEIFVVNVHGYIGQSTKRAIAEAEELGKPITYAEPI
jgi:hypothetical protein